MHRTALDQSEVCHQSAELRLLLDLAEEIEKCWIVLYYDRCTLQTGVINDNVDFIPSERRGLLSRTWSWSWSRIRGVLSRWGLLLCLVHEEFGVLQNVVSNLSEVSSYFGKVLIR